MAKGRIIFEVDTEGEGSITVQGVKGKTCKDLTKDFEKALGKVKSSTPTKEFYEREVKAAQKVGQA